MSLQRTLVAVRGAVAPLARFTARPILSIVRPTAVPTPAALGSFRSLSTFRPTLQAAKSEEAKETAVAATPATTVAAAQPTSTFAEFSAIVQQYGGWYPFLGLFGVIAVSKELLILDTQFVMVSNFAVFATVIYLSVSGEVVEQHERELAADIKKRDDVSDLQIESYEIAVQMAKLNIEQLSVLKQLKSEYNTLATELTKVKALKLRHAARDAVVKKLADVKSREASERASFKDIVSARASLYVKKQFAQAPQAVKASLIDFAIDVIEGKKKQLDAKQDPVKRLYTDYFGNKIYEQELAQEKLAKA